MELTSICGDMAYFTNFSKGVKAKKKEEKKRKQFPTDKQKNPKAFAITSARSAADRFHRKQDLRTKKHHIPVVDQTPTDEPPPIVIGKKLLFQCSCPL
jgi:ribosome biogenesis protein BMS1